jgi:DNA-binding response OmpR family regulator
MSERPAIDSILRTSVAGALQRPAILAVDDDASNRHVIGEILRREQMDVSFADSGEQALRLLDRADSPFDLILLDRMMTGIDGIEVLRRIKRMPHLATTPVVMQTAASAPDQVSEGLLAGALYYLTKPYAPAALRTIIRAALADARGRAELEQRASASVAALGLLQRGSFECRTFEEAQSLASMLAQLAADPRLAVIGLSELFTNAIEHGNLGIDCELKASLLREDRWSAEVRRRRELPEYRDRLVHVELQREGSDLRFTVRDDGEGFDHARYLELDPDRAFEPNGRGIALARQMSFTALTYEGSGNIARATLRSAERNPL